MAEDKHLTDESAPDAPEHNAPATEGPHATHDEPLHGARTTLNNNSPVVIVAAVLVIVAAIGYIIYSLQPPSYEPQPVYFYDLGTGELFEALNDQTPPITAPSGADQGVRAHVFSCGNCADPSQRFIGYLETYTPEARAAMLSEATETDLHGGMEDPSMIDEGHLVRAEEGDTWHSSMSEEGMELMEAFLSRCGPMRDVQPCLPGT